MEQETPYLLSLNNGQMKKLKKQLSMRKIKKNYRKIAEDTFIMMKKMFSGLMLFVLTVRMKR